MLKREKKGKDSTHTTQGRAGACRAQPGSEPWTPLSHSDTGLSFSSAEVRAWQSLDTPAGSLGTCKSGEAGIWSGGSGVGPGGARWPKDLGLGSVQSLQGEVLPSSSFRGLQASVPGLVAASIPVSASVSTWLLLCVRVSPLLCLKGPCPWGLGPPPIQEDLISRPSLHHLCRDPVSE